jgi:HK97 gp10 family phage protein
MSVPMIRMSLFGDKQVMARLKGVIPRLRKKALTKAARVAMRPLLSSAKQKAPKKSGALRKSLKMRTMKRSRVKVGVYIATSDKFFQGETFYGAFQEFGWHTGKRAANLRTKGQWSGVGGEQDKRTMVPGKHFIEQAYLSGREGASDTFVTELGNQLDYIAKGG